jgi:integrase
MRGGIYSDERCPICGGLFRDTGKFLACPQDPKQRPTRYRVRFRAESKTVQHRFPSYEDAERFLTGIRFKTDENTFDARDYQKENPLSFSNMADKWLSYHSTEVRAGTRKNLISHIRHAKNFFGNRNVREIQYGDLEDFLHSITLSDKSKHNILSTIHALFVWIKKRREIAALPEFPEISFDLGYRRTIEKDLQQQIIEEVGRICPNRKVYLGIKWLATYISIRPGELIKLQEGNIDTLGGFFTIPSADSKTVYKTIPLIEEDVEILRGFTFTFPATPFFRHISGIQGVVENTPFGVKYFYKWWIKACANLGIEGVDLYGGTRHSSVRALIAAKYTPEQVKQAAMSETNAAFARYMGKAIDQDLRAIYRGSAQVVSINQGGHKVDTGKTI